MSVCRHESSFDVKWQPIYTIQYTDLWWTLYHVQKKRWCLSWIWNHFSPYILAYYSHFSFVFRSVLMLREKRKKKKRIRENIFFLSYTEKQSNSKKEKEKERGKKLPLLYIIIAVFFLFFFSRITSISMRGKKWREKKERIFRIYYKYIYFFIVTFMLSSTSTRV